MPLTEAALTTLDTAKIELGIELQDTSKDDLITRYINSASDQIASICGRSFYYEAGIVEKSAGFGTQFLVVSRTPLLSIASITYNDDAVDSAEYSIYNAEAGTIYRAGSWDWTAIRYPSLALRPIPGTEEKKFEITYSGGYVTPKQAAENGALTRTLPYDLEELCLALVSIRYEMRGTNHLKAEGVGPLSSSFIDGLPAHLRDIMNSYSVVV